MEILNNRYRVIEQKKQSRLCSSYKAIDILNDSKVIQLNILNSKYIPKKFIDFCIDNCSSLGSFNKEGLLCIFEFGLVDMIDNKPVYNKMYYYTIELMDKEDRLINLQWNREEILHIFIALCQMLNYLNVQGYIYENLNGDTVYYDSKNHSIKLRDLITVELTKYEFTEEFGEEDLFKAPENINEKEYTVKSQIYSLGVFLLILYLKSNKYNLSNKIINDIIKAMNSYSYRGYEDINKFDKNFYSIIEKMIRFDPKDRYDNITAIILDINDKFSTNYKPYKKETLEKLNFDNKLVGRREEIESIMNIYDSLVKYEMLNKIVTVHGETGIGKTKFLKHLEYLLRLKSTNVYSTVDKKVNFKSSEKVFNRFIRQIVSKAKQEVINKYIYDIVKFVPEIADNMDITPAEAIRETKEKFRVINNISNFIEEVFWDKPIIILIDNLHYADDFMLEFILYNFSKCSKNNKLMMVFTYCDGECLKNKKFMEFIYKVKEDIRLDIILKELNIDEVGTMIKDILSMQNIPDNFTELIYKNTSGNPLFIEELLKDIFLRKFIYINDDSGKWYKKCDFENLQLPKDMHEALESQINEFDKITYEILSVISIFDKATSLDMISNFIDIEANELKEFIEDLVAKGVLCKKIEDRGFVYDFYNKFLKTYINDRIDKHEKKIKHKLAADMLEKYYLDGGSEYLEELIYHLEGAEDKVKLINYHNKKAETMLSLNNKKDAISSFLKALHYLKNSKSDTKDVLDAMLNVGHLYVQEDQKNTALKYFKEAAALGEEEEYYEEVVDALTSILDIYIEKNYIKEAKVYKKKVKEILDKIDYKEGLIAYNFISASMCLAESKYDDAYNICTETLEKCDEGSIEYKIKFYNIICSIFIYTNKIKEALQMLNECLDLCSDDNYREKIKILNNIGVIYSDYYNDVEKAFECFNTIYNLSKEKNLIYDEIISLINIAFIHYSLNQYDEAYDNYTLALEKAKKYDYPSIEFYCNTYLGNILYKFGRYSETYKYYLLGKEYIDKSRITERDAGQFYLLGYRIHYICGDVCTAEDYMQKALDSYKDSDIVFRFEIELLNLTFKLEQNKYEDIEEVFKELEEKCNTFTNKDTISSIIAVSATNLYLDSRLELSKRLLELINSIKDEVKSYRNITRINFLETVLYDNGNIEKLFDVLNSCKEEEQSYLLWIAYLTIANYFYDKKEFIYASIYYFESCGVILDLALQVPKEFRISFITCNNMVLPFEKFRFIADYYKYGKNSIDSNIEKIVVNKESDLEKLFNSLNYNEFIKGSFFMDSLRELNSLSLNIKVKDISDVFDNLTTNSIKNMEIIAQYLCYLTIAGRAIVVVENNKKFEVLASSNNNKELPKDLTIFNRVRDIRKPSVTKDDFVENFNLTACKITSSPIKSSMCIPIIMDGKGDKGIKVLKRNSDIYYVDDIIGYIYLESERVLNNINENILKECLKVVKILGVILDKYTTQISSTTDKLTSTLTRKYLEKAINHQFEYCNEYNSSFSILMIDIDLFKDINDRFGHRTGDLVLKEICDIVLENIRETDICGRYGGEEFIVILPETDMYGAYTVAEKVREKIHKGNILKGKRDVTISLGVATFPDHATQYEELIEKVDQALYIAKNTGRNKTVVWSEKYRGKLNPTSKFTGVISGNINQDFRNVSTIIDIIEIVGTSKDREEMLYNALGRIIESTESENGAIFLVEDNKIKEIYAKKAFDKEWPNSEKYNENLVKSAIDNKNNVCTIDWDNISKYDSLSAIPNWKSVIVSPIIKNAKVIAALYLSVSARKKEFTLDDVNFVSILGKILLSKL